MKAFKKVLCITLALMLAGLALMAPVAAATDVPLIVVQGFAAIPLVKNAGTEQELQVFPPENLATDGFVAKLTTALITGFIEYGANGANWDSFGKRVLPVVKDMLADIAYNTDGTPVNDNVTHETYDEPMSSYTEEEKKTIFTAFGLKYAEQYNEDLVYAFGYDWRQSPIDCADQLNDFISYVKARTGSNKVNVVAISQGSAVTLAYLAQYGGSDINNLVFASPAWQGTSLVGDLFNGNVELDIYAVENFLVKSADVSATTHLTAYIISFIASYEGLSHEYFGDINHAIQGLLPYIYRDTIIPFMAGIPGLWALVPAEFYDGAKTFLFPEGVDANLEAIIDEYHDIQVNAKDIIDDAMDEGMRFGIVGGYNRQMAPINKKYEQSDEVIDIKSMTGGATCALYLQAYDDWGQIYKQKVNDGHNHVSWDYKVDLSTAMYPEQTWLLKNMSHTGYNLQNGTLDTVLWLLNATEQYTVHTDRENHPQFSLYNTYKRKVTPITIDGVLGDLDDSGAVNTLDARIALKIAAGQIVPTEEQLFLGDIDEDGEISTVDARCILCMAAGVPYKI